MYVSHLTCLHLYVYLSFCFYFLQLLSLQCPTSETTLNKKEQNNQRCCPSLYPPHSLSRSLLVICHYCKLQAAVNDPKTKRTLNHTICTQAKTKQRKISENKVFWRFFWVHTVYTHTHTLCREGITSYKRPPSPTFTR